MSNFVFGYPILSEIFIKKDITIPTFPLSRKCMHIQGDTEKEGEGGTQISILKNIFKFILFFLKNYYFGMECNNYANAYLCMQNWYSKNISRHSSQIKTQFVNIKCQNINNVILIII